MKYNNTIDAKPSSAAFITLADKAVNMVDIGYMGVVVYG